MDDAIEFISLVDQCLDATVTGCKASPFPISRELVTECVADVIAGVFLETMQRAEITRIVRERLELLEPQYVA